MFKTIYNLWKQIGLNYFWGDMFDVRFFIVKLLTRKKRNIVLDIGCGAGIISYFTNAEQKIGIDFSSDSLSKAKDFVQNFEAVQASMYNLPFKENSFDTILAIHVITSTKSDNEKISICNEIKRISKNDCELIISSPNLKSKHYPKSKIEKNQLNNYLFDELTEYLKNYFDINLMGYCPYSKNIMYLFKILYSIPEKITEKLKIEDWVHDTLLSANPKSCKSFIMIGIKKSDSN